MSEELSVFCRRMAGATLPEDYGGNVEWNLAGDMAVALEVERDALRCQVEELLAEARDEPAPTAPF